MVYSASLKRRDNGFWQLQVDVCTFSEIRPDGKLDGVLSSHVGDLLFCEDSKFFIETVNVIQTFRTGKLGKLSRIRQLRPRAYSSNEPWKAISPYRRVTLRASF